MPTVEWISIAVEGDLHHLDPTVDISKFSIDTRTLQPGDFFIALAGTQTDGHRFLAEAFAKGACGALVHRLDFDASLPTPWRNVVLVDNTLHALHRLARTYRALFQFPIVAVTGSSGKTTTKELIAHMLSQRFRTYRSHGNLNSEYGLPLALLEMPRETEMAVFELGMQRLGDIRQLAEILRPTVGVITMIGDAHREFFESKEQIAQSKWELVEALPSDGIAVLNRDSIYLRERRYSGKTIWFGSESKDAAYRICQLDTTPVAGLHVRVKAPTEVFEVQTKLLGRHNARNILAACAVAREQDVTIPEIQHALWSFPPVPHRMELKASPLGWILDDSYNANPAAVKEALRTLIELKLPGYRKIFVFGEMLELGKHSGEAHRNIGQLIANSDIDRVFLLGESTLPTSNYLTHKAHWTSERVVVAKNRSELLQAVQSRLLGNQNLILVKGSRANELDKIVDVLTHIT
ncbi:UDP-N-acetylmuramoyl-tripeptide--D-alanyl-D-alanine ligase [Candidatus Acetothermia bacterium]|nr:UDP-N-acetylmuramoyl-tripeptide--D-alanyl-D-alanine ligase [Candidatus Acetothermia bacterium]